MPARGDLPALPKLERKQDFLLWNVPHPKNPFFTGREKVLEDLRKALKARGAAALGGLGGVGKTQTAVEYAYRHRPEYESVFWAKAESRDALIADFASIAAVLNLPESTAKEQDAAVGAVQRWLASHAGWLLVLDNADDLAMTREFIPHDVPGHLLLTTRARATAAVAERVEIEVMEPEEGAVFLLRRAGVIARDQPAGAANDADWRWAQQISRELGGLPLALDQAGAFVDQTPSSLAEYFQLYRSQGTKLRAERGELGDHPSVTITFSLAFQKVAASSPAAADLIRVCAYLAPDAIPEEIFTEGTAELGENLSGVAANSFEFAQALKEAGRFSLIDRNPQKKMLDIHRLVQAVVSDGQDEAEQRRWAERAVRAAARAFPSPEFPNWTQCERLLPHVQACAALIEEWDFAFQEAARLLTTAGYYLDGRARYGEAEPLYQRARAIYEKALGPEHPELATSLNNLAALYHAQGKYGEAEPLYQRARAIWEKALGPEHPNVATSLNNLALLYHARGKYEEAEPLFQRARAVREKALGPEHPDVAQSLNNLAALYRAQGKYDEAEPLYRQALAIREKALGPEHPDVATSLNNLAELYRPQGKYEEAVPLYQRALAIWEKALGPEHPRLATSLNNLAALYNARGKYEEAEPLYQRALAIQQKALGPEHPDVARSLNNLASIYHVQGKYDEAEPLYRSALTIREKVLVREHPDTAASLKSYAAVRQRIPPERDIIPRFFSKTGVWGTKLIKPHILLLNPSRGGAAAYAMEWGEDWLELGVEIEHNRGKATPLSKTYVVYTGVSPPVEDLHVLRRMVRCEVIPLPAVALERALAQGSCEETLRKLEEPFVVRSDPYDDSKPIAIPTLFYGRTELLERIPSALLQGQHAGIFGLRKIGKTSLLNQLRARLACAPVVYLDCQSYDPIARDLFNEILKDLYDELRVHRVETPGLAKPVKSATDFRSAFLALYGCWQRSGHREPVVVVLDEVDKLFPDRRLKSSEAILGVFLRLFRVLRALAQGKGCLALLVTAYRPEINRQNLLSPKLGENPMFLGFKEDFLGFLDCAETHAMVKEIGLWKEIQWDEKALERIFEYGGGHPMVTRFLASDACNQGRRKRVDEATILDTIERVRATFHKHRVGDYYSESIWNVLQNDERSVLKILATDSESVMRGELRDGLANLEHFDIIQGEPRSYRIRGKLFEEWVRRR
jgi:tetratricopeptide (TPR) repeat protein